MTGKPSKEIVQMRMCVGIVVWVCLGIAGCGVKGPPVPPRLPSVPAVVDLGYTLSADAATLTWSLAAALSAKQAKEASFVCFRSRTPLASEPCETCPQLFEKVLTIPYADPSPNRFAADVPLDGGFRYQYKIRLETRNGIGSDSNTVAFDVPSAGDPGNRTGQ